MAEIQALEILRLFGISSDGIRLERLTQGYINDTFRVHTPKGDGFVLQRINGVVFPAPGQLMENLEAVLPFLSGPGYRGLTLEKNLKGTTSVMDAGGSLWRVFHYIPDSVSFENITSPEMAAEAGRVVAAFHNLVSDISPRTLRITLAGFHDIRLRQTQLEVAVSEATEARVQNSAALLEQAKALCAFCQDIPLTELPLRVCHNDTKLSNILFEAGTKKALCLIDLDTLMPGHLLYDFGDAARGMLFSESETPVRNSKEGLEHPESEAGKTVATNASAGGPKPESETGKTARENTAAHIPDLTSENASVPPGGPADLQLFKAFVKGWESSGLEMSPLEIRWLCHGVVLMPALHGIRALSDYLSADRYYKVAYPEQNLDRARRLLNAAQTAQKALRPMQEIIRKFWA